MDVQRLVLDYNNYDFDTGGVPAKSFGGTVYLSGDLGKIETQLSREIITSILELISVEIVSNVSTLTSTISAKAICRQAYGTMLEHDSEENGRPC